MLLAPTIFLILSNCLGCWWTQPIFPILSLSMRVHPVYPNTLPVI
jgi:hypothetical protein